MDDPNNQPKNQPAEPKKPDFGDPVGPPPNPREASGPDGSLESRFDPNSVSIDSHDEAFTPADAEENPLTEAGVTTPTPDMHINKQKSPFKKLITSKKFWFGIVFILLAIIIALWFIRDTRTWIVNFIGIKTPVTVMVRTVAETGEPSALLQKTRVTLSGTEQESNEFGQAKFMASYGQNLVVAEKPGYETASYSTYLDFNPFFGLAGENNGQEQQLELQLKTVGLPLKFRVVDWLTEQPVTHGELLVGDAVTIPDDQGYVSIKVPPTEDKKIKVTSKVDGYVSKEQELTIQTDPVQQIAIIPAGKLYFISNRTGSLGIYSSDLDGGNVAQVVAPSPNETSAVDFSPSPNGDYAVLASTREGAHDSSNNLLQKLYVVNLQDGSLTAVDEGLWFDFVDWSGNTVVYLTASSSSEQELSSLKVAEKQKTQLDTASKFGQVRVALNQVVYEMEHQQDDSSAANNLELRVLPVGGGTAKNIGNKVQVLAQTDYDKVVYRTSDNAWHEYNLNTSIASNAAAPASADRVFLANASADGQTRLLVDKVDGVNTLIAKNVATGKETVLYANAGLTRPMHWAGNLVVLRIIGQSVAADYVLSISMDTPRKVNNVVTSTSPQSGDQFGFY